MSNTSQNLNDGLEMVDALISLESHYSDPPSFGDRANVNALRAGAIVLLVSTFEEYLKHRTQDAIKYLNSHLHDQDKYIFESLPKRLIINHYHLTAKFASEGNRYDGTKDEDRIPFILRASIEIQAKRLDPLAFSQTHSNPNSFTLKRLFHNLGLDDTFKFLSGTYMSMYQEKIANTYIEDKLNMLINLRNMASHAISTMNVSRRDVSDHREFAKRLCSCIDKAYTEHCDGILKDAERT